MKIDRLLAILTTLLQKDRTTAPELAERFEVSRRTVGRDLDTLCQAGIPIVTYQGNGGGISIADGFKLDKSILTADELSTMIAALKGIGSVASQSHIERMLDKLHAGSDTVISINEPIMIDLSSYHKGQLTEKIEMVKKAVLETRIIEFDYSYAKGDTHRRIEPCFVIFQWSAWYVFGFCLERQDWRLFKLLRLWNLKLCADRYSPRVIPLEKRDFNIRYTGNIQLVALFDPAVKYQLIESYGMDCFTITDDGLLLSLGFTNRAFLISWLLSFGKKVKVLEPSDIKEEIKNAANDILLNYC